MQLHNPAPAVITVAGTNGKGTTCRMIEALLLQGGYRVGSTLSPHIWRFNERIRLHGRDADDEEICAAFAAIDLARGDIALTYFEFSALAALYCMAQAQVDVAILEIGHRQNRIEITHQHNRCRTVRGAELDHHIEHFG